MTSMKSLEDKDYYIQSLAMNDGLEDPVLESDFDFMQNGIEYENPSPLHNEDLDAYMETEDDIENGKDVDDLEDIDDELLIVSEEEALTCGEVALEGGVACYDKHEQALSARIDIEAAEEEADNFDESDMYRELAKMEIVEEEEFMVTSTIDKLPSEELETHVEEELDLLGRPVRLYSTPRNQLVYAIGNIQISHSQARLFHLFDKNGEINVENIAKKCRDRGDKNYNNVSYKKTFCRVKALANPRCVDTSAVDEEAEKELTFQPTRSKQAGWSYFIFIFTCFVLLSSIL